MGVAKPRVPHLLILHGLEATIQATYAHGLLARAGAAGWSGDLLMFRSCDGVVNSAPRLYHSGETGDLDWIIRRLHRDVPEIALYVCGVSLGGNVLLKWLGERQAEGRLLVRRAAAVSTPFDLAAGSRALERGIARLYAWHFLRTLRRKALAKAVQFPDILDVRAIRTAHTFWSFDDAVTAPLHGFRDAGDYYEQSSSMSYLRDIQVPTFMLGALNDPIVPRHVNEQAHRIALASAFLDPLFTSTGGHVGWIEGPILRHNYYMEELVIEYFKRR
jgi:hypothetical protein